MKAQIDGRAQAPARHLNGAGPRHFLDLKDFSGAELRRVLDASAAIKGRRRKGELAAERPLTGKTLAMVFDRPSTRTRVSFDVAMRELGGETLMLTGSEMQLGRGETIGDTAQVLSRFVDAIMIRILDHGQMLELAEYATVPVINALTKISHPCQIMADVLTFEEHCGPIKGRKVAWSGDANNVLASWVHAAARFDFTLNIASPPELAPPPRSSPGRSRRAPTSTSPPTPSRRWRASMPWSPIAGCRWATTTRPTGTTCSAPIRSTPS